MTRKKSATRRVSWAVCALVGVAAFATTSSRAAFSLGPDSLQLVAEKPLSARLTELTFTTPAVTGETHVRVLLPDGYDANPSVRFPVLLLLHGALDDETSWTVKGDAEAITAGAPLIVVMPDSGTGGGYTDWYNAGAGGTPMWETYHIGQLVPWIDQHYRTNASRSGRAIGGLSMGGFGTMSYAARHPDMFSAAASFSGAVDSNSIFVQPLTGIEGWQQGRPGAVFGHRLLDEVRWRGHNPWDLAENLAGLDLTLRTGNGMPGGPGGDTGDPVETEVHEESLSMHRRLVDLGIPHVWDDYGAGGHDWYYWQRDLVQLMPQLAAVFATPPPPPSPFTFRAIEPSYDVWGWHVDVDRPALEFSELRNADQSGFSLLGSGTAIVTTAPLYAPGSVLSIDVIRADGVEHQTVAIGGDCRLRIDVPLGPGNPHQQYTLLANVDGVQRAAETIGVLPPDISGTVVYATHVRVVAGGGSGCP